MKAAFSSPGRKAAVVAILALLASPAWAQEGNVYDLELVVFLNEASRSSEVERPDTDRAARYNDMLSERFQRTGAVVTESAETGRLAEVVDKLAASGGYTVLQHVKWRQEVKVIAEAPYVDVSALGLGEDSGMRGLVRFYHSPLLYVDLLLRYRPFSDPLSGSAPPMTSDNVSMSDERALPSPEARTWFLDEKRRVKLKELHYLDHPHLGAIIGVWPIEESTGSDTASADS